MTAYYNEIDPYAAQWLRNLIAAGHIAPGDVDTRSIVDVRPDELAGYSQCHFFAGIGVWSYAARLAGWPDDRPLWTGSCPCQPFSAAGKGGGFADERHLWPAFFHLIEQCRPPVVLGEQVASKDGLAWLDLVRSDLEAAHYACGAVDTCAAGFGAPHIRQRLYWVARPDYARLEGWILSAERAGERFTWSRGLADGLEYAESDGRIERGPEPSGRSTAGGCELGWVADTRGQGRREVAGSAFGDETANGSAGRHGREPHTDNVPSGHGENSKTGPTNGFWRDPDWLFCRDGKWRPVEPGTFPPAHGTPARMGRLRAYGNAINAEQARGFIESVMDAINNERAA